MKNLLKDSQGTTVLALITLMSILLSFIGARLVSSQLDLRISSNRKTATQAFFAAEAGIQHALREMDNGDLVKDFEDVLGASSGTVVATNSSFSAGTTYTATLVQKLTGPNRVRLRSVGTAPTGAQAEVEGWFKKASVIAERALITRGDLLISGNPWLGGSKGGAHSNDDIQITGSAMGAQMAGGISASDSFVSTGSTILAIGGVDIVTSPCIGSSLCSLPPGSQPDANRLDTGPERAAYEAAHSHAPTFGFPLINPADYASAIAGMSSGYVLASDCKAYRSAVGSPVVFSQAVDSSYGKRISGGIEITPLPAGFSCAAGNWTASSNNVASGSFYVEGTMLLMGSPGTTSNPWQATIVSRGSMEVSGSPTMVPYVTGSGASLQNTAFLTGRDFTWSGNGTVTNGAAFAHHQVLISGNPTFNNGFVIAGDGYPTWTGDPFPPSDRDNGVPMNEVSGNPNFTYNGLLAGPYQAVFLTGQVQTM